MHRLRTAISESFESPVLTEWMTHKRYAFVLLVDRTARAKLLTETIKSREFREEFDEPPLIRIHRTATHSTVHEMINEHKERQQQEARSRRTEA